VATTGNLHPERVPQAESATADPRKFTHYLLNEEHEHGRGKAKFFKMNGYDASRADELREALLAQLPYVEGRYSKANEYTGGDKYEAVLRVEAEGGQTVDIRTFWEVHPQMGTTLITAYPLES
jgi:hypothetical protein